VQVLQLPLGIIKGIAQGEINILVSRTIYVKAVGVDLRTGHDQVNHDQVGCPGGATVTRAFERHMTLCDPLAEALQPRSQFPCASLEGSRVIDVTKR
jgi:hypothetical protein